MLITPITDDDVAQVILLWQACDLLRPWNDPQSDIALARSKPACTLLVGKLGDTVVASAMAGFDGHRGWLYYVAVRPDHQGKGFGRKIIHAAEEWLTGQDCPKVELIIRSENTKVMALYSALGYCQEPRALMSKWLKTPPVPSTDMAGPRLLDVTVTYLEMSARPTRPPAAAPPVKQAMTLLRVHEPSVHFYRYLQHTVGDPWLWSDRRKLPDDVLASIIQNPEVELYVLSVGGVPAGFIELDFREFDEGAEVAYFGLMPDFIGRGLGPYLLDWGVDCAWNRDPAPPKLMVNTCTLDHPRALSGYQKAGFEVTRREQKQMADPVATGHIAKSVTILSPGYDPIIH